MTGPTRPRAIADLDIDYASLPQIEAIPLQAGATGPSLARGADGVFHPTVADGSITYLQVGAVPAIYIVGGNSKDPAYITHPERVPQMCTGSPTNPPAHAMWLTFAAKGKQPESLDITRYEGSFDSTTCTTKAERSWHVVAKALVSSTLYAFRSFGTFGTKGAPATPPPGVKPAPTSLPTRSGVAPASATAAPSASGAAKAPVVHHGDERLEIIGPRSIWVGTNGPTELQNQKLQEPFVRLVVPLDKGSSASAMLDVAADDLKAFRGSAMPGIGDARVVSFSFEVVWPGTQDAPSATAFVYALAGSPEQLGPPEAYSYEQNGNTAQIDFLE